jgi:hypothetical protein
MNLGVKIIITIIASIVILTLGNYVIESVYPVTTTDVAVRQVNASDADWIALRTNESMKMWLVMSTGLWVVLLWLCVFWADMKRCIKNIQGSDVGKESST